MSLFLRDIRYALRTLSRSPAFTLAAVLALCLAIGAHTAVFSVVHALLSFPVPLEEPDRVALLFGENPEQSIQQGGVSADDFLDYRRELKSFSNLTAGTGRQYNLVGTGEPVRVTVAQVTPGFFAMAGVDLHQGRGFLDEEGTAGRDKVAVVGYGFWQQSLGGDPDVLGRILRLDGDTYTVVGVAPEGFFFLNPNTVLWTPLVLERGAAGRDQRLLVAAGRLSVGVSAEQASAEARAVAERLATTYPDTNRGWSASVVTVPENLRQGVSFANILLYSSITFVLLIACVNVANLILARSLSREREIALRSSLGASRPRLLTQLLVESVVLSLVGGGTGFVLGLWGIRVLRNWIAPDANVGFIAPLIRADVWVFLHAFAISTLAGIVFGLVPAFQATRGNLASLMNEGGRGGESRRRRFLRDGLVMAEVALALALLVTAGTLIRAFERIYEADPGLDPTNLLTLQLALPERDYPEPGDAARFLDDAVTRLEALPGVEGTATTTVLPLTQFPGPGTARASVEGQVQDEQDQTPNVAEVVVSPGYFETMKIDLRSGRTFDDRDREDGEPVAVVTEKFVERFLEGGEGVGARLRLKLPAEEEPGAWRRIVGVVADHASHAHSLRRPSLPPLVFLPLEQAPRRVATVLVRTQGAPLDLAGVARAAIWDADATLPIDNVKTLEQAVAEIDTQNRFFLRILTGLALVALVLAAVGIYGIIAYSVTQRTREIGIRAAFGARPQNAVGLVARQAVRLTSVGVVFGCGIAYMLVRFMGSQLEGISQTQAGGPMTFVGVVGLFVVVALLASTIPSIRAARLDPVQALRDE